jgi:hypothetical protein
MKLSKTKASELGKKSSRKGIPNKTTIEIRQAFQMLISNELPNLSKWLNEVATKNPEKALDIIVKFSDFVIPKLSRTETDITSKGKEINIAPIEWVE